MIEQPRERNRLLDLAERIEGETLARWLAIGANPYPPADERHAITDKEIIRRDMVRAARARKKHG